MSSGIYVHVPFCVKKCDYCDFYSLGGRDCGDIKKYADTIIKHMTLSQDKTLFCDSLYLGGGTPSLLSGESVKDIVSAAKACFTLSEDCEITLECNPGTVDVKKLRDFLCAGVNRISLGVQSLNDTELSALGRLHNAEGAKSAIEQAHSAGFENISCDVMFGIPHQTRQSLLGTLDGLLSYPITHISAYGLKIEPSTPFARAKNLILPDEDEEKAMYFDIISRLNKNGFEQYEISNFALNGKVSRHNIKYWRAESYLSFGPCAASYINGQRYTYTRDIEGYCSAVQAGKNPPESERYTVDTSEKREEKIIFGLRLTQGISLTECGLSAEKIRKSPVLSRLLREGYITLSDDNLALSPRGFYISNSIINELIEL